jgi:DNA polymerase sigma
MPPAAALRKGAARPVIRASLPQVNQQLLQLVDQLLPPQEEHERNRQAFERVQGLLLGAFPDGKVGGSCAPCT